jgi:CheY-like chemotaxis protein
MESKIERHVFLVEDNHFYASILKHELEAYCSQVTVLSSGEACLEQMNKKPDVVLLDYNLSGELNGIDVLKKIKELDELVLEDEELYNTQPDNEGNKLPTYLTSSDSTRFTLQLMLNANPQRLLDQKSFEFGFSKKLENVWLELLGAMLTTNFHEISERPVSGNESSNLRSETSDERLLILGIGAGYRFRFVNQFIQSESLFEMTKAYLTYNSLSDDFTNQTYTGLGLRTDYEIHRRLNNYLHLGFVFSYHLSSVSREAATSTENRDQRSLTLSYTSMGINLSMYY